MALLFKANPNNNLKLICKNDSAISPDLTKEEWEQYTETGDESFLRLVDKPTRFVFKRSLSFEAQQLVSNAQLKMDKSGEAQIQLGFMLDEFRYALVGIENPDSIPEENQIKFARDVDGYASKELVAYLNSSGYMNELYGIRTKILQAQFTPSKK